MVETLRESHGTSFEFTNHTESIVCFSSSFSICTFSDQNDSVAKSAALALSTKKEYKELILSDLTFTEHAFTIILKALSARQLFDLRIIRTTFTNGCFQQIKEFFSTDFFKTLKSLDISGCKLEAADLEALLTFFADNKNELVSLSLNDNNLGEQGSDMLCRILEV